MLKVYPARLVVYHQDRVVTEHVRSYDRYQDFEKPEHVEELAPPALWHRLTTTGWPAEAGTQGKGRISSTSGPPNYSPDGTRAYRLSPVSANRWSRLRHALGPSPVSQEGQALRGRKSMFHAAGKSGIPLTVLTL
jgi:hypothetical protein